jgi:hypothetical protein
VGGGQLIASAVAWNIGVTWGQARSGFQNVSWGLICTWHCGTVAAAWYPWTAHCVDAGCSTSFPSGSGTSENVVWQTSCGLLGCITSLVDGLSGAGNTTGGADADGDTVVWGTTGDGDTVVWGTTCADSSCEPVVWQP